MLKDSSVIDELFLLTNESRCIEKGYIPARDVPLSEIAQHDS